MEEVDDRRMDPPWKAEVGVRRRHRAIEVIRKLTDRAVVEGHNDDIGWNWLIVAALEPPIHRA
jgi:hypothetical protein